MTDELSPWEQRLADEVADLFNELPQGLVDECQLLVRLDPSVRGLRMKPADDGNGFDILWVGRYLGTVMKDGVA